MQSEHFIFNGIKSIDMDQYIVRIEGATTPSPFFGGQSISEEFVGDRIKPYHFKTTKDPIEFTIEISPVDEEWTPQRRNEVGRWLIHDTYKPFQTTGDMGKIYYAIATQAPNFTLYGNRGYVPFTFRTNSPYAWSPEYIDKFDLSDNIDKKIIVLENLSNINKNYKPIIEIELVDGETNIALKNLANKGKEFIFTDLIENEIVSIDNENEDIVSNRANSNPFAKFNKGWLELVYGENRIEVKGKCILRTKMQFPILQ